MDETQTPAGWYHDPAGQGVRWWDGQRWTNHVRPHPAPPPPVGPPPPPIAPPRPALDRGLEPTEPLSTVGVIEDSHRPGGERDIIDDRVEGIDDDFDCDQFLGHQPPADRAVIDHIGDGEGRALVDDGNANHCGTDVDDHALALDHGCADHRATDDRGPDHHRNADNGHALSPGLQPLPPQPARRCTQLRRPDRIPEAGHGP